MIFIFGWIGYSGLLLCSPTSKQCLFTHHCINLFHFILSGKETIDVASHVSQFVFMENNGFRFPFAHFPTKEADPTSLYTNFWKAFGWLKRFGFQTNFCCCDGGEANRSFIKMHFKEKDPVNERFTTINPYTRKPMGFFVGSIRK